MATTARRSRLALVIGEAERVYLDDQSARPTWVTVRTSLFRTKE
jgi:hypothetical protein